MELREIIERAWEKREYLKEKDTEIAIKTIIADLDAGQIRVAEPQEDGSWKVNDWVKKAVILYFPIQKMQTIEVGPFEFHDKMALKTNYAKQGVRVVPHAVARYGAHLASGVVMMLSCPLDETNIYFPNMTACFNNESICSSFCRPPGYWSHLP